MRIAVVGSGIAGLTAAHCLHPEHDVTVFEANPRIGGHTNTIDVTIGARTWPVDTGFIVFNDWTYPAFRTLIAHLDVPSRPAEMSFSVRCDRTGREYKGDQVSDLFIQKRNVLQPSFWRMVRDIVRFNTIAPQLLPSLPATLTLGDFLTEHRFSRIFIDHYIVPMGASIWSAQPAHMADFGAAFFIRFLRNHGMLNPERRRFWRTVVGGSKTYAEALSAPLGDRIRTACPVAHIERTAAAVTLTLGDGNRASFDHVFLACHSDQALALLADPSVLERQTLEAIRYQPNEAILHTDASVLPRRTGAWASWNYHIPQDEQDSVAVTYYMNRLQGLRAPVPFCVTLNDQGQIAEHKIIERIAYAHPILDARSDAAKARAQQLDGTPRTSYCGAYWHNGFHEDGVCIANSFLESVNRIEGAAHA
ncbi:MAG: FAD-dependent oxidoreductase, partial [Pseudomonadota bacterium]